MILGLVPRLSGLEARERYRAGVYPPRRPEPEPPLEVTITVSAVWLARQRQYQPGTSGRGLQLARSRTHIQGESREPLMASPHHGHPFLLTRPPPAALNQEATRLPELAHQAQR